MSVCVKAVESLDQDELNEKLIGIKKVPGGGLQDSIFVNGVSFKKTVRVNSYGLCTGLRADSLYSSPMPGLNSNRSSSRTQRLSV